MGSRLSIDQVKAMVGQELGDSSWVALTQELIDLFADATRDHQFLHVDPERARQTPFGTTIAHGFLTLSMMSSFANEVVPEIADAKFSLNYGFNRVRFLAPVKSGKRIRGRFVLKDLQEQRPGHFLFTYGVTVEIEGEDKPALVADWLGMTVL